jgi:ATP-binding cassette, subfamily C, bacterial CydD
VRPVDPRLLREAPAARRFLVAAATLGLVTAVAIVAQAAALARIVDGAFLRHERLGALTTELAVLLSATTVRAALAWALESGGRLTALTVAAQLRAKLLAHLLAARPGGVRETPAGELAAAAVTGLDALDPYFARFLPQLVLSAIVPAVIFGWVVWHDLTSAIVMAMTLPLIPIFGILIGKLTRERTMRRFGTLTLLSAHFLDVVRGLPTLRAFGRSRVQTARIDEVSDSYRRETMGTLRIAFLSALVLELAATLSTAVIAVEIGVRLVDGGIALAPALTVLVLAPEYYGPLRAAAAQFHASADGLAAAQRVFELLDLEPAVRVPARPVPARDLEVAPLSLENVVVRYPGRSVPAVDGLSVTLAAGDRVAVAGPSGAGKTTLLALLLRLLDPTSGRIAAGGVDLARVDPRDWRRRIAWLPQRPVLPPGTLRDTLAAGRTTADDDLWLALERAAAFPIVSRLADGLETVLDERTPLSAGEIRRLALARTLVEPKPLLLLDEPTAHLDGTSAGTVVDAIAGLPREGIVLVATHDPRVLDVCDRLVELAPRRPAELPALEAVGG